MTQLIRSNRFPKIIDRFFIRAWQAVFGALSGRAKPDGKYRVLVAKSCCMGDGILSLYALREWKSLNHSLSIHILTSERNRAIYEGISEINKVYSLPLSGKNLWLEIINPLFWVSFFRLAAVLRRNRYDELVDMELYYGYPMVLKTLLRIPESRGFRVESAYKKRHDKLVSRGKDTPEWVCFFQLLGLEVPYDKPLLPLYPKPVRIKSSLINVGIVSGASFNWPQKQWPVRFFIEVMSILSEYKCRFILFGTEHEAEDAAQIAEFDGAEIENTVGRLSFQDLRVKAGSCSLILGNDTGTMHLAAAMGIPCVTIFGPTNNSKWNPLTSTPVFTDIACRPCYYLSSMPACSHVDCLKKLAPRMVADACLNKMGQAGVALSSQSAPPLMSS